MSEERLDRIIEDFNYRSLNLFFRSKCENYAEAPEGLSQYDDERFTDCQKLGEIRFNSGDKLVITSSLVSSDLSERSGKKAQYEKAKKILKEMAVYDAGFFIFHDNTGSFRFSLVYARFEGTKRSFSNFRRFTYFVTRGQTNKTFRIRVGGCTFLSLEAVKDAFSVEKVNKEFYNHIARFFYRLTGYECKREMTLPSVSDDDKETYQEFAVRLIGRAIFCWFLKHKKSANGISLIPDSILSSEAVRQNSQYYHATLEKLFFEVLNTPQEQRHKNILQDADKIPFLNGGLFEPHKDDFYSGKPLYNLVIPDTWFEQFFEILEQYNFTIDENSTVDADVSVDPEMLGRIFENLLAEVNPETGETARKATGSYYTRRTIVDYMVDQSLKQYLLTKTKIDEDRIIALLSYEAPEVALSDSERVSIISAIDEIKIIDPACGSGAFPMGILHKMLLALQKVDPNLKLWLKNHLGNIKPGIFKDRLLERIQNENWEYVRKLIIIQKSIYGVDIQTIAVEISKLRFFLSLIVDEQIDDLKNNRGVEALPNLEFKFVAANSLIGLPPAINRQIGFGGGDELNLLKELRNKYLRSYGKGKKKIEEDFRVTRGKLIEHAMKWSGKDTLALQLANWNPFSNEASEWFDPSWMFGIEDDFDVVIANPPYDVLNITEGQRISPELLETIRTMPMYKIALGGKLNFFRLFIARAFNLMRNTGVLTYIIPYSFMCDSSAKALREFVLTEKQLKFIEAFPERDDPNKRLFEAVKMSTCIVCIKNTKEDILFPVRTHYSTEISLGVPTVHVNNSIIKSIDPKNLSIPLMSDTDLVIVKHLLRNVPTRLSDFGRCYEGEVNLTFHKKFLSSKDSFAPMIKGAAIQRYQILEEMSQGEIQYLNSTAFLKYNTSPKSKHHRFRRIVMQGITGVNEAVRLKMTIIDSGIFCGNSVNYILMENPSLQQEYLLALLNSRLMNWFFKLFSTNSNVNGYQVDNLPIAKPGTYGTKIVGKVNEILSITKDANYLSNTTKQTKVRELEHKIDQMVYELYGLTPEEIAVVKGGR